jgi:hypothetical protein
MKLLINHPILLNYEDGDAEYKEFTDKFPFLYIIKRTIIPQKVVLDYDKMFELLAFIQDYSTCSFHPYWLQDGLIWDDRAFMLFNSQEWQP